MCGARLLFLNGVVLAPFLPFLPIFVADELGLPQGPRLLIVSLCCSKPTIGHRTGADCAGSLRHGPHSVVGVVGAAFTGMYRTIGLISMALTPVLLGAAVGEPARAHKILSEPRTINF